MIGYKDFNWKKNKLFLRTEDTKISVVPDKEQEGMFRVKWPDGVLSEDFYNLARVKDTAINYGMEARNKVLDSI